MFLLAISMMVYPVNEEEQILITGTNGITTFVFPDIRPILLFGLPLLMGLVLYLEYRNMKKRRALNEGKNDKNRN